MGGIYRENVRWNNTDGRVAGEDGRASDSNHGFKEGIPVVTTPLHAVHLEHGKGFGGEWPGLEFQVTTVLQHFSTTAAIMITT